MATILAVDDDPDVLELIDQVLRADGHQVEITTSGQQALEWLGQRPYDLIVSDIEMPGITGIGLYEATVARAPALARRFVFITGSVRSPAVRTFVERTRARVLSKPFHMAGVRIAVREALDGDGLSSVDGANVGRVEWLMRKLQAGLLPVDGSEKTWYGNGRGLDCDGCEAPITAADVEVEADFRDRPTLRFHSSCFDQWRAETRKGSS